MVVAVFELRYSGKWQYDMRLALAINVKHGEKYMIILSSSLSYIWAILSLIANTYLIKKYGDMSLTFIIPAVYAALAIFLAFSSGELYGRKQQQKYIMDEIEKSNRLLRIEMDNAYAKVCCSECDKSPFAGR